MHKARSKARSKSLLYIELFGFIHVYKGVFSEGCAAITGLLSLSLSHLEVSSSFKPTCLWVVVGYLTQIPSFLLGHHQHTDEV